MSAATGRPAARTRVTSHSSSYRPADLRVDDPRLVVGITPEAAASATAVVRRRSGDDSPRVLAMLGLAVTS